MIKRMAAVALMAFVGLALAVSPSYAADEAMMCDDLALDSDAMFSYAADVSVPEAGHPVVFCEKFQQTVPTDKFKFHYTYSHPDFASMFSPRMS